MARKEQIKRGDVIISISTIKRGVYVGQFRVSGTSSGKYKNIGTYKTIEKARDVAKSKAIESAQAGVSANSLTEDQLEMVKMIIKSEIRADELRDFLKKREGITKATLCHVLSEWIESRATDDLSKSHRSDMVLSQKRLIDYFKPGTLFSSITTSDLSSMLVKMQVGAKRQKSIRAFFISIWTWAELNDYTNSNVAMKIPRPKIKQRSGGHEVLTPNELALLLHNADGQYQLWIAIGAFAGLRTSEMFGNDNFDDRLKWSDFNWSKNSIVIRPETSKTSLTRIVPISSALKAWLELHKEKQEGHVFNRPAPHQYRVKSKPSVTKLLGALIGGWRDNCLRASRASYRLAETGDIQKTAMEDGHTVHTLKKNYLNPRFEDDAAEWWSMTPERVADIIQSFER